MATYLNLNLNKIFKDTLKAYRNLQTQNVKDDSMSEKEILLLTYTQLSSKTEVLLNDCVNGQCQQIISNNKLAKTLNKNELLRKTKTANNCDKTNVVEYHVRIMKKIIGSFDYAIPFMDSSQKDEKNETISDDDSVANENVTADVHSINYKENLFVEKNFTNNNNNNNNKKNIKKSKNESDQLITDQHIIDIIESVIDAENVERKKTLKQKKSKKNIAFLPETSASDNSTNKQNQRTFIFNPKLQHFMPNKEKDKQKSGGKNYKVEEIINFENTHINPNKSTMQILLPECIANLIDHSNVTISLDFTKLVLPKSILNTISSRIRSGKQTNKIKKNVKKSKTEKSVIARYVESFSKDCELNELNGDKNNETTKVHKSEERGIQDSLQEQISLSQFDQLFTTTFLGTNENDDYIFPAETPSNANIMPKKASQKLEKEPQKQCTIINNCEGVTAVESTIPMDEDFVIPKDIENNAYCLVQCIESDSASFPQQLLTEEQTADMTVSSIVGNTINVINEHEHSNYREKLNSDGSRGSNILYNSNCKESSVLDLSLYKSNHRRIVNSSEIVGISDKENTNNSEVDKPLPNKNMNWSPINKNGAVQNDYVSKELLDTSVEDTINKNLSSLREITVKNYQYDQNYSADNKIHNSVIENEKAPSTQGNQDSRITASIENCGLYKDMPNLDDVITSVLDSTNQLTDFPNSVSKDDNNETILDYEIDDDALSIYANSILESSFSVSESIEDNLHDIDSFAEDGKQILDNIPTESSSINLKHIDSFDEDDKQILDNIPTESSSIISTQTNCAEKKPEALLKKFKIPKLKVCTPDQISSTTEDIVKSPLENVEPVSTTTILYDIPTGTSNINTKFSKIYNTDDNSCFSNQQNSANQFNLFNQINQFSPSSSSHYFTGPPLKQCNYKSVVYNIFGNPCFGYLTDSCTKSKCKYSHELLEPDQVKFQLARLNNVIIYNAYNYIWRKYKLFVTYFRIFCEIITERNDKEKLLSIVKDCEMYTGCVVFLKDIVKGLTKIGLSHTEAIKLTMKNIRGQETSEMMDVFIDLILESDVFQFIQILDKYSTNSLCRFRISSVIKLAEICIESKHSELIQILLKIILYRVHPDELRSCRNSAVLPFLEMLNTTAQNIYGE